MTAYTGPNPPTQAQMEVLAEKFAFTGPHRNVCVRLRDGRATIKAPGMPDFEVWYAPPHVDVAVSESEDTLEIVTQTEGPYAPGTVCLGISTQPDE